MKVKMDKVIGLALTSLLVLSFWTVLDFTAMATPDNPLPLLYVKVPSQAKIEVWLMGDQQTELDPWWDIGAFDIRMHFNVAALTITNLVVDPVMWFESFWPGGISVLRADVDNINGLVRVVAFGIPDLGGSHTPPYGKGVLFELEANVVSMDLAEFSLMNSDPRPSVPPWGPQYFAVDLAGFPHPERQVSPWLGSRKGPPIPHLVSVQPPPVARFTISDATPGAGEIVTFDASSSSSEVGIVNYEWDFETDGFVDATGVIVGHSYSTPGFFIVTLKVTDAGGMTGSAIGRIAVHVLQYALAEHRNYKVTADEDEFNTLSVIVRNLGTASGDVKATFTTMDRRTNIQIGLVLETTVRTLTPGEKHVGLSVDFKPSDFEWTSGTVAKYDVTVELLYYDEPSSSWQTAGTFKLVFKVSD